MASIKVNATDVIRACKKYDVIYHEWRYNNNKKTTNDDGAWIEEKCKSNNANAVEWIRKMADVIEPTQYPYVILTEKDFHLIGKYLV